MERSSTGFFSQRWIQITETAILAPAATQQAGKGTLTMLTISNAIHELSRSLWIARNEVLHGDNSRAMQLTRSVELAELRDIHAHPELLPAGDRHYCDGTFEQLLRKSPSSRRRWLRHLRMVKARMTHEGTRQRPITDFFQRVDGQNSA